MRPNAKIATCCYCGTRAALVLDEARHELACSACGAPLHDLKALPVREARADKGARKAKPKPSRPVRPPHGWEDSAPPPGRIARAPKRKKSRKRRIKSFLEDVFDAIEDIID